MTVCAVRNGDRSNRDPNGRGMGRVVFPLETVSPRNSIRRERGRRDTRVLRERA